MEGRASLQSSSHGCAELGGGLSSARGRDWGGRSTGRGMGREGFLLSFPIPLTAGSSSWQI